MKIHNIPTCSEVLKSNFQKNKYILPKNQGITILQIVLTITVMVIILSVSIFYGQGVSKEAKIASVYNEIKIVENALEEAYVLNDMKIDGDFIKFLDEEDAPKVDVSLFSKELAGVTGDFYYLDFTTSKKLENVLGLENVDNDYLFDYSNLNIYLVGGIELPSGEINNVKYNSDDIVKYYSDTFVK